jgi:L-rhamnose mutarotase
VSDGLQHGSEPLAEVVGLLLAEAEWGKQAQGGRAAAAREAVLLVDQTVAHFLVRNVEFDLDTALSHLATLPRQQEWETYMSVFQDCSADATSADKWQPMERMFHLYE